MIYHVELKEPWTKAAAELRTKLKSACPSLRVALPQIIGEKDSVSLRRSS